MIKMATNKWMTTYEHVDFKFSDLKCHVSWRPMIQYVIDNDSKNKIPALEEFINRSIKNDVTIYPEPDEVLNAFQVDIDNIKVVILGQDPYFNEGQANGCSFSVRDGVAIPPSLKNMNGNLLKFGHIDTKPTHGDLTKWVEQGVLLLNTALTVTAGMPNSHKDYWILITNAMITYISNNTNNVTFMLWGGNALGKLPLIDQSKHNVTISSHPSPMSVTTKLRNYDCFENTDHFGKANKNLIAKGITPIDWSL